MKKLFGLGRGLESLIPKQSSPPSETPAKKSDAVFMVEVRKIRANPDQPREQFGQDGLKDLAQSIRKYGVLQPLLVAKIEMDTLSGRDVMYQLIAGERRLRAAKLAGLPRVPVVIRDDFQEPGQRLEAALIENLQREDLNALEEAEAYQQLAKKFNLTQQDIALKVGKSREVITNAIRLLNLPPDIRRSLRDGMISRTHARALLAISSPAQQRAVYKQILSGGVTTKETESLATNPKQKKRAVKERKFSELEGNLGDKLKAAVLITGTPQGGRILIKFASLEELNGIVKSIID